MRLNSREVQHYARYSGPADKQGHLLKRGAFNTQFKRRWFALKGNLLFYYRTEDDNEPQGVIILADCRPETCDVSPDPNLSVFKIKFDFGASGAREYELAAESEVEMLSWMKAITDANYDMLRIAVEDVKQRVIDARAKAEARKSASSRRVTYSTRHDAPSNGSPNTDPAAAAAVIRAKMAAESTAPVKPVPYQPDSTIQQQASAALDALGSAAAPMAPPRRSSPTGGGLAPPRSLPRHTSSPNLRKAKSVKDPHKVSRVVEEESAAATLSASPKARRARSTSTPRFRLPANKTAEA
eukprot:m.41002 g.41002  ORF g.41002 m.41002 type:complete len:297 (-) comp12797_c0_seq1:111-1001(-)